MGRHIEFERVEQTEIQTVPGRGKVRNRHGQIKDGIIWDTVEVPVTRQVKRIVEDDD